MTSDLAAVLERHASAPGAHFGAVAAIWHSGELVDWAARGWANAYELVGEHMRLLPIGQREAVDRTTRFDIASLTKLFTATVAMSLVDEGSLDLDEPVGSMLPEFVAVARGSLTMRQLLTHTAGLVEDSPLWNIPYADRLTTTLTLPSTAQAGTFSYSCVGYIAAGTVLERLAGESLRDLVRSRISVPLAMAATDFGDDETVAAATEWEPWAGRGLVRGEVHDEMAWALGGVAGNAGLFSTVDDLGSFANSFLTGSLLSAASLEQMAGATAQAQDFAQAIGFRVEAPAFMGALSGPHTIGHTGFTGTSVVIDRVQELVVVVVSNRVHATREYADSTALRADVAAVAARLT